MGVVWKAVRGVRAGVGVVLEGVRAGVGVVLEGVRAGCGRGLEGGERGASGGGCGFRGSANWMWAWFGRR